MFKKLLLAASMAALTTGSAHAVNVTNSSLAAPALGLTPAMELNLPGVTPQEFTYLQGLSLNVDNPATSAFPTGTTVVVTITLPAGVEFVPGNTGAATITGVNRDTSVDTMLTVTPTVSDPTSASFLVSTDSTQLVTIEYTGNLEVVDCDNAASNVTITVVTDAQGTPVDGGTAISTVPLINNCKSALNHTVTADTANDSIVLLATDYESLADNLVGNVAYYIDNSVDIDGLGNNMIDADITSIDFDVVLGDGAGIQSVTVGTFPAVNVVGDTASFSLSGADVTSILAAGNTGLPVTLQTEAIDGVNAILNQTVEVANAEVTFNDGNADLDLNDEDVAVGPLESLVRQGQSFGPFDWNDGRAGRTTSVYRATGFEPQQQFDYTITMTNSIFAAPNNVFRGTATSDIVGEFVMTSVGFGGAVPPFGRGDAQITYEVPQDIDVDRLMVRNGISTNFGDGSNEVNPFFLAPQTPTTDSDNGNINGNVTE